MWRAAHSTQRPPKVSARYWARERVRLAIVVFAPRRCRPYITARATPPAPSTSTFLSLSGLGVPGGTAPPSAFSRQSIAAL